MKKELLIIILFVLFFGCIQPEPKPIPQEKYCETDSDCEIKYNVLYEGSCSAGCFNKKASVVCDLVWEGFPPETECACINNSCKIKETVIEPADFEIHEWGVLAGCSDSDDFLLTSRPEHVMVVKEPVIYIHSNELKEFDLTVNFLNGEPTLTYPKTQTNGKTVEWNKVKIKENCLERMGIAEKGYEPVPLEFIIPVLNDVKADCLEFNETESRFLFYEGEIPFENKIQVEYDKNEETAVIKNNSSYSVFDVSLALGKGVDFITMKSLIGTIEELKPGEKKTIELKGASYPDLKEKMTAIGFTEKEALSFKNLWNSQFFYPTNTEEFARLSYRLPQKEIEKMISLTFNPKPKKVLRSLWVLVKVEG